MEMPQPTVAILGASRDRRKFGNQSVRAHLAAGFEVFPVNPMAEQVEGIKAYPNLASLPKKKLDRISVYLPPAVGLALLEEIAAAGAREVWLNPGSESPELLQQAAQLGLPIVQACSIIDASRRAASGGRD
jgi:hypothetical protein